MKSISRWRSSSVITSSLGKILSQMLDDHRDNDCLSTVEIQTEIWKSNPKRRRRPCSAGALKKLISKPVLLTVAVQQFFQEPFISKRCEIVLRAQLEKQRHCYAPSHPL